MRLVKGPKEKCKEAAIKQWHRLVGESERAEAGPELTIRQLAGEFLQFSKIENSERTYEWYRDHLVSFVKVLGALKISDLKRHHITRWTHKLIEAGWSDKTRNGAICAIKRVFNWAEEQELISRNPVRFVKPPRYAPGMSGFRLMIGRSYWEP